MDADLALPLLLEEATRVVGRLQEAWPWLAEALLPGTAVVVARAADPRNAERNLAEHFKDRTAAFNSTRGGKIPSGPHAAPMTVKAADARKQISDDVQDVVRAVRLHVYGEKLELAVLDPTQRVRRSRCWRCTGVGWLPRRDDEDTQDPPPTCPVCNGRGDVSTGAVCVVCRAAGPCPCDWADAYVAVGLDVLLDVLPKVTSVDVAAEALRVLDRADQHARAVAGVGEDRRPVHAPCPACGRRGDFYAEVSSADPKKWVIRCDYPGCVCMGTGCGCGRPKRTTGLSHLWPAAEWDGPGGLAARLGVDLPGTGRAAAEPTAVEGGEAGKVEGLAHAA